MGADGDLEVEARAFGRYLVGRVPPPELIARYREASRALFPAPVAGRDAAVLGFARRHAWSVAFLDAAAAFLQPGGMLRNRILLMAAILEASPEFADEFLPRQAPAWSLLLRVAGLGLLAAVRALAGTVILAAASRSRA